MVVSDLIWVKRLSKLYRQWKNILFQAGRKLIGISSARNFEGRLTKSGPKSWSLSTQTEKNMLPQATLKLYKLKQKLNLLLISSTNGTVARLG